MIQDSKKSGAMKSKVVLLAMGNDILGDDGVALAAARQLRKELEAEFRTPSTRRGEGVNQESSRRGGEGIEETGPGSLTFPSGSLTLPGDDSLSRDAGEGGSTGGVAIIESAEAGLAIMELLEGAERALIMDCIATGKNAPGTLMEFTAADFRKVLAPSPHYAGLPEVIEMAKRMGIDFPLSRHLRVLAMEVQTPLVVREGMSPAVLSALPAFIGRAKDILRELKGA